MHGNYSTYIEYMPQCIAPKRVEFMPMKKRVTERGQKLSVVALVYDKLCTFEYGIAAEVFGLPRPELGRELYDFSSVALEKKLLKAAGGLTFKATGSKDNLRKAHTIVVPGWRGKDEPVPNQICTELQDAHGRGARILSICSGVYVLAAAGLLDNKTATTHWRYAQDFKSRFPNVIVQENELYVDEGDIITSAGSSAGIDACLHIVRSDYGVEVANLVARRLVMHSHRQGSQAQFIEQPIPESAECERLAIMMENVRANLKLTHCISSMAKIAGMSSRTFQRQFVSLTGMPAKQWLTHQRILRACELLETTNLLIDRISQEVGFTSTEAMRYHFRQVVELSPNQYRMRFSHKATKQPRPTG